MKFMKKVFLAVLTIAVVACLFVLCGVTSYAETITGTYGALSYSITDGEVTITACDKNATGEIIIPDTIEGYPVVVVESGSFLDCNNVTMLVIGKNVKHVGGLFTCTDSSCGDYDVNREMPVEKVVWNAIDGNAIEYCYELAFGAFEGDCSDSGVEFILGEDVERIPDGLCYGTTVKSITVGNNIKTIGRLAFSNCSNLKKFNIPESVTTIEDYAFYRCYDLEVILISENVSKIGSFAFCACNKLSTIYWNARNVIDCGMGVLPDGFYKTEGLDLYFGDNIENIPDLTYYGSPDSFPGVKYIYVGYNTSFSVNPDRWLMLEKIDYATKCSIHTDENRDNTCDVCDSVISIQTPEIDNNDNDDAQSDNMLSFFNSIVEMFNKIIAWIKSIFGIV